MDWGSVTPLLSPSGLGVDARVAEPSTPLGLFPLNFHLTTNSPSIWGTFPISCSTTPTWNVAYFVPPSKRCASFHAAVVVCWWCAGFFALPPAPVELVGAMDDEGLEGALGRSGERCA